MANHPNRSRRQVIREEIAKARAAAKPWPEPDTAIIRFAFRDPRGDLIHQDLRISGTQLRMHGLGPAELLGEEARRLGEAFGRTLERYGALEQRQEPLVPMDPNG